MNRQSKIEKLKRRYHQLAGQFVREETAARLGDVVAGRRADRIGREMTRIENKLAQLRSQR